MMAGTEIYTPTERAILCDYFGVERPAALSALDVTEECPGIFLQPDEWGEGFARSSAVARIALANVQGKLPVWALFDADGNYTVARTYDEHKARVTELFPVYLFEINWADSGPGISWPEAYYLTWLPEFDRFVLTASQDSPDCYGFTDITIGHAEFDPDLKDVAKSLITAWWRDQLQNREQEAWAYLFGTGLIKTDEAHAWRDEVWGVDDDEEDADEGEEDES